MLSALGRKGRGDWNAALHPFIPGSTHSHALFSTALESDLWGMDCILRLCNRPCYIRTCFLKCLGLVLRWIGGLSIRLKA